MPSSRKPWTETPGQDQAPPEDEARDEQPSADEYRIDRGVFAGAVARYADVRNDPGDMCEKFSVDPEALKLIIREVSKRRITRDIPKPKRKKRLADYSSGMIDGFALGVAAMAQAVEPHGYCDVCGADLGPKPDDLDELIETAKADALDKLGISADEETHVMAATVCPRCAVGLESYMSADPMFQIHKMGQVPAEQTDAE